MLISVVFSEIVIKGANRRYFENLLIKNMKAALSGLAADNLSEFKFHKSSGRILISNGKNSDNEEDVQSVTDRLSKVFGIDSLSVAHQTKPDMDSIQHLVISKSKSLLGKAIRVETKRSDKKFPIQSQKVSALVGASLVNAGCSVNLEHPDKTIYIEILPQTALVYTDKVRGFSGMPVGSSGKVLSLLSGGIDSPVASWLMMKRGCLVDFLHIHSLPDNDAASLSKIVELAKLVRAYAPSDMRVRLYQAPYHEFYKRTVSINPRFELVLFRRFLLHLSNELCDEFGYKGVVTGDSMAQVASQTIDNLFSTDEAARVPTYRPLIGMNKQEIIDLSIKLGTYQKSIEPYKDCCSLVANTKPSTRTKLDIVKRLEKEIDIGSIVSKTKGQIKVMEI